MKNANKSRKNVLFCNAEGSGKVIWNPYPGSKVNLFFPLVSQIITKSFN